MGRSRYPSTYLNKRIIYPDIHATTIDRPLNYAREGRNLRRNRAYITDNGLNNQWYVHRPNSQI